MERIGYHDDAVAAIGHGYARQDKKKKEENR
jgi:hypothetical protein